MLRLLRIKDFGLLHDLTLELGPGLTVITGETGAGKSMIIDAVAALCGERVDDTALRAGAGAAEITGVFDLPEPARDGELAGSEQVIIRRRFESGKRPVNYANDQIISQTRLRDIGQVLLELVGQHENQSLFQPRSHLAMIDAYGRLVPLREAYRAHFLSLKDQEQRLAAVTRDLEQRKTRRDLLAHELAEIEACAPGAAEEQELLAERSVLVNAQRLAELTADLDQHLYQTDTSSYNELAHARKILEELTAIDERLSPLRARFEGLVSEIDELHRTIATYRDRIESSPERLELVLDRIDALNRLKKKHGGTIERVLAFREEASRELAALDTDEHARAELETAVAEQRQRAECGAAELGRQRRRCAAQLERQLVETVARLGMEKAAFEARFTERDLTEDGRDDVEFYMSTNPGEPLKPLRKIASGGEISRITLALKTILTVSEPVATIIFDEVDTGIGGRIAEAVGELLAWLSHRHQVLCVTHLPQISVFARQHILVHKAIRGKKTTVFAQPLDDTARRQEIARMLAGKEITRTTIEHAEEILAKGKARWTSE